jgi:histone H3/H4
MPRKEKRKKTKQSAKPADKPGEPPKQPARKKPRFKPETLARRAVARAQKQTCQYIPFTTFNRLVHEVLAIEAEDTDVTLIAKDAVQALWTESEAMLVDMFNASNTIRAACKRHRLTDTHMRAALRSADVIARTSHFRRVWNRAEGAPPPHIKPAQQAVEEAVEESAEEEIEPAQQSVEEDDEEEEVVKEGSGFLEDEPFSRHGGMRFAGKLIPRPNSTHSLLPPAHSLLSLAREEERRIAMLRFDSEIAYMEGRTPKLQVLRPIIDDVTKILQKTINKRL